MCSLGKQLKPKEFLPVSCAYCLIRAAGSWILNQLIPVIANKHLCEDMSELTCNQVFVSRTDDKAGSVGGGCSNPHYRCLDHSSGVGVNTAALAPGPPDPLQEADISKTSIMDEKNKDGEHGLKKRRQGQRRWIDGW